MPAGRPLEPAGNGRPRWMTAHREAARRPWTEPGVQADSSVARRGPALMGPERAASVRTKRLHVVGGLRQFSPGSRSPSSRLQVLMTISFAMRWLASPGPLQYGGVDVERRPDDEAASVRQ